MEDKIKNIEKEIYSSLKNIGTLDELNNLRIKYFGKKGEITSILRNLGTTPKDERPKIGKLINELKEKVENLLKEKDDEIRKSKKEKREKRDITLPEKYILFGRKHPLCLVLEEIEEVFLNLGFEIADGPEIETDYYNFEALNIPAHHPARDMFDTFHIKDNFLLRTHTSPVQVRVMEKQKPPLRVIVPGRIYRHDAIDATHSSIFHQVEGFMVDTNITFSNLKGILVLFLKTLFREKTKVRFRPSYFPFTEPSAEVDVSCIICEGKGCNVCSNSGWLEILGSGMIHPNVLENVGIDSEKFTGFAFGLGVERIAMLKYRINDIRLFLENDLRFLEQF